MSDPVLEKEMARARSAKDAELQVWTGLTGSSPLRGAAVAEIERRKFWRAFWSHGIIAWVALIFSGLSLGVSVYVAFFKHGG